MSSSLRKSSGFPLIWAFFLAVIGASLWAWWRFGIRGEREDSPIGRTGFDLAQAPRPDAPLSPSPSDGGSPRSPSVYSSDLPGIVRESRGTSRADADAERERKFAEDHATDIQSQRNRITTVGDKYKKKYPVVDKLVKEIRSSPRLRALKEQYKKDKNLHNWIRGAVALPEVKDMVRRYSADPAMWRAGIGMGVEVLRNPPPAAVYTELLHTLMIDPVASKPFSEMFTMVLTQLPTQAMSAVTPGTNLTPLLGLAGDLSPGGKLDLPPIPGIPETVTNNNDYWRGYKDGYEDTISQRKGIKSQRTM
ncbi:MAG TPA: hypothetical protein VNI01_11710 [Elusimicrobiota bacterium]|nr:hypothetical protein [Elusimicrobiota bacterium]